MTKENHSLLGKSGVSCDLCGMGTAETTLAVCLDCKQSFQDSVVKGLTCQRCGHRWFPRSAPVKICPACKTKYWRIPKNKNVEVG